MVDDRIQKIAYQRSDFLYSIKIWVESYYVIIDMYFNLYFHFHNFPFIWVAGCIEQFDELFRV